MSTSCPEKPEAVPLYYAAMLGFRDLAEHLIVEHPEHVNAKGGEEGTPTHAAAAAGHVDTLSLLFEHGADLEGRNRYVATPLHQASRNGKINAEQYLLDRGANIHVRDNIDFTPLFWAVNNGHVEPVRMLLERGANANSFSNSLGEAVLHRAVKVFNIEAVRLLLEHGADVNACDRGGRTPSQLTEEQEILELLCKYGAKSEG